MRGSERSLLAMTRMRWPLSGAVPGTVTSMRWDWAVRGAAVPADAAMSKASESVPVIRMKIL